MKYAKNTTQSLKLKSSISFEKSLSDYFAYKSTSKSDLEHYEKKVDSIYDIFKQIQTTKRHSSRKVSYGRSKDLQYFVIEKHAILFRITKTTLHVLYFVPEKRIKKPLDR